MTIEECYQKLGGDFAQVCKRFPNPALVERFITKFLSDGSYQTLCEQMEAGNRGEAFRASHTLKGVCANLGFDRLFASASKLTDAMREESPIISEEAKELFETVKQDYEVTASAVRTYLEK